MNADAGVKIDKVLPENFAQMVTAETEDAAWALLTDAEQREMHYLNEGIDSMWEAWAERQNEYILSGSDDRPSMPQPMEPNPDPVWFRNFQTLIVDGLRAKAAEAAAAEGYQWNIDLGAPADECPF